MKRPIRCGGAPGCRRTRRIGGSRRRGDRGDGTVGPERADRGSADGHTGPGGRHPRTGTGGHDTGGRRACVPRHEEGPLPHRTPRPEARGDRQSQHRGSALARRTSPRSPEPRTAWSSCPPEPACHPARTRVGPPGAPAAVRRQGRLRRRGHGLRSAGPVRGDGQARVPGSRPATADRAGEDLPDRELDARRGRRPPLHAQPPGRGRDADLPPARRPLPPRRHPARRAATGRRPGDRPVRGETRATGGPGRRYGARMPLYPEIEPYAHGIPRPVS